MATSTKTATPGPSPCYASLLGGCHQKLTGEHYFSKSLMKELPGKGKFVVSGFPWLAEGEERTLSIDALQGNILCKTHNNALSRVDDGAAHFVRSIKRINNSPRDRLVQTDETFHVDGPLVERWLLKVLCGLTASGNLWLTGTEPTRVPDPAWVRLLYDREPWPPGCGLYLGLQDAGFTPARSPLRVNLLHATTLAGRVVAGIRVELLGFIFAVSVAGPLDNATDEAAHTFVYRPGRLLFQLNSGRKQVIFEWPRPWEGQTIPIYRTAGSLC